MKNIFSKIQSKKMLKYFVFSSIIPMLAVVCFIFFSPAKTEAASSISSAQDVTTYYNIDHDLCLGCSACVEPSLGLITMIDGKAFFVGDNNRASTRGCTDVGVIIALMDQNVIPVCPSSAISKE